MFEINFNKIMQELVSEDFETQCTALESVRDLNEAIVEQAIKGFETSQAPDLIIEGLANIGFIVRQKLESFVETSKETEKITLASIVLLYLGSRKGVENVINEFVNQGKHEILAVGKLIQAQVPKTGDIIIERLRKFSLEELQDAKKAIYVDSLLRYLNQLKTPLPKDLEESFEKIK